jgi:hypothetical protein
MNMALLDTDLDSAAMKDFVTDWIRIRIEACANLKRCITSAIMVQKGV